MFPVTAIDLANLGDIINSNRGEFLDILTRISTWKAAQDEIDHVIETLHGAPKELYGLESSKLKNLVVYLPPNVILFSYVLYILMPSPFVNQIMFRPSVKVREESYAIHKLISSLLEIPAGMSYDSRSVFWKKYASIADLIVFNGRCQNALEVGQQASRQQIFLYFGSGVNPFIVGGNANIDKAVHDGVAIRLKNSGQDCLCPDLFLVQRNVSAIFIESLKDELAKSIYGERTDPSTDYSNLSYPDVAESCLDYLDKRQKDIILGGKVNVLDRFVQPTILLQHISELNDLPEFFAPIFNVVVYDDANQIEALLKSDLYVDKAMGVMLYGAEDLATLFKRHIVVIDKTLFDINHGNLPFGGWGKCASHIRYQGKINSQPLLISDILKQVQNRNQI